MGLYVNSVAELPMSAVRSYYLYVLDYYNWDEPVSNALRSNSDRIARACAASDAVMIAGLPNSHFSSEVLSWVKINGQDPSSVLPALLLTTVHPSYFINADNQPPREEITDALLLLKIRDLCKDASDVVQLLENIFRGIRQKQQIKDFAIVKELRKGEGGALVDALVLEPNFAGVGVDLRKLIGWAKSRARGRQ